MLIRADGTSERFAPPPEALRVADHAEAAVLWVEGAAGAAREAIVAVVVAVAIFGCWCWCRRRRRRSRTRGGAYERTPLRNRTADDEDEEEGGSCRLGGCGGPCRRMRDAAPTTAALASKRASALALAPPRARDGVKV